MSSTAGVWVRRVTEVLSGPTGGAAGSAGAAGGQGGGAEDTEGRGQAGGPESGQDRWRGQRFVCVCGGGREGGWP